MSIQYYVADSETLGLKSGWHEMNQLSIKRCSDGVQKSFDICVVHPERASKEALDIQGITRQDLKRGLPIKDVVHELTKFIEEDGLNPESRCIVGHNVAFDRRFAHAAWEQCKTQFPADLWLCTKKFFKNYVNKVGPEKIMQRQSTGEPKVKFGQDLCLIGAGLQPKYGAHTAEVDCENCYQLWDFLMHENLNHVRVIEQHPHRPFPVQQQTYDY